MVKIWRTLLVNLMRKLDIKFTQNLKNTNWEKWIWKLYIVTKKTHHCLKSCKLACCFITQLRMLSSPFPLSLSFGWSCTSSKWWLHPGLINHRLRKNLFLQTTCVAVSKKLPFSWPVLLHFISRWDGWSRLRCPSSSCGCFTYKKDRKHRVHTKS